MFLAKNRYCETGISKPILKYFGSRCVTRYLFICIKPFLWFLAVPYSQYLERGLWPHKKSLKYITLYSLITKN